MANQNLADYIKSSRASGANDEMIRQALLSVGWQKADIDEAFNLAGSSSAPVQNPKPAFTSPQNPVVASMMQSFDGTKSEAPVTQSNPTTSVQSTGPHFSKKLLISFVAAGVLLLGGGAFGFYYYSGSGTPEEAMNKMYENLASVKTYELSSKIEAGLVKSESPLEPSNSSTDPMDQMGSFMESIISQLKLNLTLGGAFDSGDNNPKGKIKVDLSIGNQGAKFGGMVLETRLIDKKIYTSFSSIDIMGFMFMAMPGEMDNELSKIIGKWFVIDPEKDSADLVDSGVLPIAPDSGIGSIKKAKEILSKYKPLSFGEKIDSDKAGDISVDKYGLTLNQDQVLSMINESLALSPSASALCGADQFSPIDSSNLCGADKKIDIKQSIKSISINNGEIWIGKSDYLPYRIKGDLLIEPNDTDDYSSLGSVKVNINFEINLKNFNQPVEVVVPENVLNLKDFIKEVSGEDLSDLGKQSKDATVLSDIHYAKESIGLYLAEVSKLSLCANSKTIYSTGKINPPVGWKLGPNIGKIEMDGSGWIPVNLNSISTGSPLEKLPLPPDKNMIYIFACDPAKSLYEFNAVFGSEKFADDSKDDGGNDPGVYEVGTNLNLIPNGFWKNLVPAVTPTTP
jgi:hypothetical protein